MSNRAPESRTNEMHKLRESGATCQQIADKFDLLEAAAIKAEYTAPAITLETDLETTAGSPRGEPDGLMEELKP